MASTLFRGPVLVGKKNEAGVTGYNITPKEIDFINSLIKPMND